jgi:hypothetical protein
MWLCLEISIPLNGNFEEATSGISGIPMKHNGRFYGMGSIYQLVQDIPSTVCLMDFASLPSSIFFGGLNRKWWLTASSKRRRKNNQDIGSLQKPNKFTKKMQDIASKWKHATLEKKQNMFLIPLSSGNLLHSYWSQPTFSSLICLLLRWWFSSSQTVNV